MEFYLYGNYVAQRNIVGNSVYHDFRKWSKVGAWNGVWIKLLEEHKGKLDMSYMQLDGRYPPLNGGEHQ